jgi:TonB-linked SusC/RagA family outer membrane protein
MKRTFTVFETKRYWKAIGFAVLFLPSLLSAQSSVSGTVKDEKGEPLLGVAIQVKDATTGTVTDIDGNYTLEVPSSQTVLRFSYTGFATSEVVVGSQSVINVTLASDISLLEEVVVVGYGTQKKANLTGAVSVITSEALEKRPITSAGVGLQGLIPNLNITIRNGDPTQRADFNIRGFESINGGSPLILVDGVPMDIERINPNDIASVNVLKDASAAAVYGARAAFGVILVETKRGKSDKVNIQLSSEVSFATPILNLDLVEDPYDFVQARNLASMRTDGRATYDDDYVAKTKAYSENPATAQQWGVVNGQLRYYGYNNYQNEILRDISPQQRYDLSVSGANKNANYYVSLGFLNKDGYLQYNNENFKRYNGLVKVDFKVNNWLSLDEKVVFNQQLSDKPHFYNWDVNVNSLARVNPIQPIQFPDLEYYITPGDREKFAPFIGKYFEGTNFFPYLLDGGRETFTVNDLWLTQGVTLTPIKGLRIRGDFSYNNFNRSFQDVQSKVEVLTTNLQQANLVNNGFSGDDWVNNQSNYNQYFVINTYAEYSFKLGESHAIKAMTGFNQEWGINSFQRALARGLITPGVPNLNTTTGVQQTFGGKSHVALRGVFYRLNYVFRDKYLLEANGRYDGTSRFPEESRFGFFPSFSAGWRISEEPFMAGTRGFLDNLKVRASYGELGNQLLGDNFYPYIPTMGIGTSPYILSGGLIPVVRPAGLVSPTLTWETVVSRNIGLDITMLKQRLDISVDAYTRDTKDMLADVDYPAILGTAAPDANIADLRTTGWELALTWRDKIQKNWNYRFTLALSDWTAQITKYDNPTGALNEWREGQKIGEIWGYVTEGIFQSVEEVAQAPKQTQLGANWRPGDIRYKDVNGDGVINAGNNTINNPGDRVVIGNTTPRYSFGVNFDISYKNLTLTSFFQGYVQRDYFPTTGNWTWFFPFNAGHVENYYLTDTWTENNRNAYFPAAHISTNDKKNLQTQSRYLQNAGFARLKNLALSYELPQSLISRIGLGRAQIYLAGMNLWEFTRLRKPLDPESIVFSEFSYANSGAIEYPLQRIYSVGVNVGF